MPQHPLPWGGEPPPNTTLVLEVADQTLLSLCDATEVTVRYRDVRDDTTFVCSATLHGVEQDLLATLVEKILIAWRYGTREEVRAAVVATRRQAREHAKAHERE